MSKDVAAHRCEAEAVGSTTPALTMFRRPPVRRPPVAGALVRSFAGAPVGTFAVAPVGRFAGSAGRQVRRFRRSAGPPVLPVSRSAGQPVSRFAGSADQPVRRFCRSAGPPVLRSAGRQVRRSPVLPISRSAGSAGPPVRRSAGRQVRRSPVLRSPIVGSPVVQLAGWSGAQLVSGGSDVPGDGGRGRRPTRYRPRRWC